MRGGPKTLILALVALLLAVGLVACGGGDSSDSSSTTEASAQTQAESKPSSEGSKQDKDKSSSNGGGSDKSQDHSNEASKFVPKQHSDSGGGSAPYKTKGGDNSVQEFGGEADSSEFDSASATLHNFLDARAEGNWVATCEYLSSNIKASFEKVAARAQQVQDKSCAGILSKLVNPAAKDEFKTEAAEADVRSFRSEGEQGFVLYTVSDGTLYSMPMSNEDGAWKVSSLSGYPLSGPR